ncbi:hypothetical protein CRG98_038381 [Punica granatum]|uniref:Uncharacterized protein n=1 Tax=Punica granatum TaxID=22663 RepID=A0A2I0IBA3_PUNGR|nr:hypothetical protein CRG98_038381 [Punica granatum]
MNLPCEKFSPGLPRPMGGSTCGRLAEPPGHKGGSPILLDPRPINFHTLPRVGDSNLSIGGVLRGSLPKSPTDIGFIGRGHLE